MVTETIVLVVTLHSVLRSRKVSDYIKEKKNNPIGHLILEQGTDAPTDSAPSLSVLQCIHSAIMEEFGKNDSDESDYQSDRDKGEVV
ncbi:hypothetical protein Clacol_007055 [Clathrus columnatus]|uniref:Uncharacterized protein n=1 Tax=Clathrus columnatus TaxID=1419009 RepID=A0AAV5AEZ2_9AGAM|nr:hypothetical protein Clacol_007055 [Clathrus columnatus]